MSYWIWAGTCHTTGGLTTTGKLHFVEVEDRDDGDPVILVSGRRWSTMCRSFGPLNTTRGFVASGLHQAIPCKPCWEAYTAQILTTEEADR